MSEMIERVARAICLDAGRMGDSQAIEQQRVDRDWRNHIASARTAIEAMREPTKAQLEAAEDIVVGYDDFSTGDGNIYLGIPGYPHKAQDVWAALVDAALKEEG